MDIKWIKRIAVGSAVLLAPTAAFMGLMAYMVSPVKEQPKTGLDVIVCIGDSITFGSGVLKSRRTDAYPYLLNKLLKQYEVLNYGYSGATATFSGNQPYGQRLLDAAKAVGASIYIVMLGTNDSKPQNWDPTVYRRDMTDILTQLKSLPHAPRVIVMSPIAAFAQKEKDAAAFGIQPVIIRDEIRGITQVLARELGLEFLDMYSQFENRQKLLGDGVHPELEGNRLIAETIQTYLESHPQIPFPGNRA